MTDFPIVGVGASAGGVQALEGFFRGLPDAPGVGVVVITHLSPDHESRLHEIIARYTALDVQIAADGMQIEPNRVYVLPPDALLGIERGCLVIRKPATGRRERKPIDIFFAALAVDQGEFAAGVVLSGGESDGTLGIKAIKEGGGLTLAQVGDGYGPQHPSMPESAISTGLVDFALPADEMGARLAEFARDMARIDADALASDAIEDAQSPDGMLREVYALLRNQVGHDFSGYKIKTFLRRVQRRMQVRQRATDAAYVELLRQDPQEVGALFRDLLINVTNFFRDAAAFESLAKTVVPELFEGRGAGETVRVWVPACATGEEVYTIAILLREHMDTLGGDAARVQIFATDIDERALLVARTARYPEALLDSVSAERRQRFFVADGASYVVAKDVRDLCVFSPHSLIRDPPFSRIDLLSCRNLLIYFGADVQNQVVPIFHYALRPNAYLLLGTAENIGHYGELFEAVDKKHRLFRRRPDVASGVRMPLALTGVRPGQLGPLAARKPALGGIALRQAAESEVLEHFAPAYVVVNRDGEVVYFSLKTGRYLEAAAGAPSRQLQTMARRGLRLELRNTFRETLETGRATTREGIAVETDDGRVQLITLNVAPMQEQVGNEPLFLVLFADEGGTLSREEALNRAHAVQDSTALQVERELRETRERLQSMIEEYETALEELKASNEELTSVNEELQSSNEELEASKEELQSVNEELQTVNTEMGGKVDELDRANSDLHNLFENTDVATIFLDRDKIIRSFTPAMTRVFSILPGDRGRPITDFSSRFSLPDFDRDFAAALAGERTADRRVDHENGEAHYLVRLAPYRDAEQAIDGVVAAFVDITNITRAERRQQVLIAELQHRTRNLLTVVQAIATRTVGRGQPVEALTARLGALGRVQGLIGQASGNDVELGDIVGLELHVHAGGEDCRVAFGGPPVLLGLENVQAVALALHELTTNAVKHGALNGGAGRLDVRWTIEQDAQAEPLLVLIWRESGVATPPDGSRRGYGRELIERALSFTLQAKTDLVFGSDGVSCRIEIPLPALAPRGRGDRAGLRPDPPQGSRALETHS